MRVFADLAADLLDERTTFFYVCSNWPDEAAAAYVEEAEKRHPGFAKSCVDRFQELTVVDRRTGKALSWKCPGGHRVKLYRNGFVLDETIFFVRRADGMIRYHGEVKLLTHSAYGGPVKSSIHNFMLKRIT